MTKYERPANADLRVESAITVIEALLPLKMEERMKRKFLSNCLWQITQAEGKTKYDIRYRSEGSKDVPVKKLRHDHVTRRKVMIDTLMNNPTEARSIARQALGCVVTTKEHKKLGQIQKSIDGWERYRQAGIAVRDMTNGELVTFPPATDS